MHFSLAQQNESQSTWSDFESQSVVTSVCPIKKILMPVDDAGYGDLNKENGGAAEYVAGAEHLFAKKPDNVSFEQAAAVPLAGLSSYQGLVK